MVSEVFGPTVQGEGPYLGTPAIFLRLMGCNLACRWCDTAYTWDATRYDLAAERQRMTVAEVAARIEALGPHLLVISGGEPLLQQARLQHLVDRMPGRMVHIETAGTVAPRLRGVSYVVSLKLYHSGNAGELRYRPEVIDTFMRDAPVLAWKFVLGKDADYAEVDELVPVTYGGSPFDRKNCRLAHRWCNRTRWHKPVAIGKAEIMADPPRFDASGQLVRAVLAPIVSRSW